MRNYRDVADAASLFHAKKILCMKNISNILYFCHVKATPYFLVRTRATF